MVGFSIGDCNRRNALTRGSFGRHLLYRILASMVTPDHTGITPKLMTIFRLILIKNCANRRQMLADGFVIFFPLAGRFFGNIFGQK